MGAVAGHGETATILAEQAWGTGVAIAARPGAATAAAPSPGGGTGSVVLAAFNADPEARIALWASGVLAVGPDLALSRSGAVAGDGPALVLLLEGRVGLHDAPITGVAVDLVRAPLWAVLATALRCPGVWQTGILFEAALCVLPARQARLARLESGTATVDTPVAPLLRRIGAVVVPVATVGSGRDRTHAGALVAGPGGAARRLGHDLVASGLGVARLRFNTPATRAVAPQRFASRLGLGALPVIAASEGSADVGLPVALLSCWAVEISFARCGRL